MFLLAPIWEKIPFLWDEAFFFESVRFHVVLSQSAFRFPSRCRLLGQCLPSVSLVDGTIRWGGAASRNKASHQFCMRCAYLERRCRLLGQGVPLVLLGDGTDAASRRGVALFFGETVSFVLAVAPCPKRWCLLLRRRSSGWSGAGVGVGMLRGAGDSLTWKTFLVSWCLVSCFKKVLVYWFVVSWFQSLLVSKKDWLLGFEISKFQRFNDPMLPISHFMFFDRYWFCIKEFQDFIRQFAGFFGARLSRHLTLCISSLWNVYK